jgi:hypothetical protein
VSRRPVEPMDMGDIVAGAFSAYWRELPRWLALTPLLVGANFVLDMTVIRHLPTTLQPTAPPGDVLRLLAPGLGALLAIAVVGALVEAVATAAAASMLRDGRFGLAEAYLTGLRRLPAVLIGFLLVTVVAGILIGTVLLIPLAVYLAVVWGLVVQVIIIEGESPFRALGRSRQITTGHWWRTALVLVAVILLATLPVFVAGWLTGPFRTPWVSALGASLALGLAAPFQAIAHTLLYADLRRRKGEQPFAAPLPEAA